MCTEDTLWGSPRLDGRRLAVGDVISLLNGSELSQVIQDYELSKIEILEALHYCSSLQCKIDKPKVFCHNCTLRREQDGPLNVSEYEEQKINGEYYVKGNGLLFFGSMKEFLEDYKGKNFWEISTDLLIDLGPKLA